ncbi:hypothetical protein P154DRAFT_291134 [Amniculicola lignicola CBS 123094]|uniref:Secreted protein n=1 Tax=Amniculicola lignicola CBS 123094 TaxID=1392246 RepID=A0A6A5X0F8_9PLEO|nr:hypothetical protein P154DRAFT_291134 [Amniculicola lignicola CBS 123094]
MLIQRQLTLGLILVLMKRVFVCPSRHNRNNTTHIHKTSFDDDKGAGGLFLWQTGNYYEHRAKLEYSRIGNHLALNQSILENPAVLHVQRRLVRVREA